jgi:hypothetical protein
MCALNEVKGMELIMNNLNFENYFETEENKYYEAQFLILILENILGKPINVIKKDINDNEIVITKKQIEEYLKNKFSEENPELKSRIEISRPKRSSNIVQWTEQDIASTSQEFIDGISASRYHFEPYTLEYFNRYTTIVRNKANLLLDIIEKIGVKNTSSIQDKLIDLDIVLDENGNISRNDIIRLIIPTVYNIQDLKEKIEKANDLSTYLTFKMSKDSLYRNGLSENEVYPTKSLQIKNLFYDFIKGNVRLSENQRQKLKKEESNAMIKFLKMLSN